MIEMVQACPFISACEISLVIIDWGFEISQFSIAFVLIVVGTDKGRKVLKVGRSRFIVAFNGD